jgi:hypothetical protein
MMGAGTPKRAAVASRTGWFSASIGWPCPMRPAVIGLRAVERNHTGVEHKSGKFAVKRRRADPFGQRLWPE